MLSKYVILNAILIIRNYKEKIIIIRLVNFVNDIDFLRK